MKNNYFVLLFLPILIMSFTSCIKRNNEVNVISLSSDLEIDMLSDSTFWKDINCIVERDGDIYVSMIERMQIARMDKDLNLKNTIGHRGRGPGEFVYLNNFCVEGNEILIGDELNSAFIEYTTDGEFKSSGERGNRRSDSDFRFCIENGKIYFSRPDVDTGTSLAVLGIDGSKTDDYIQFGNIKNFNPPFKTIRQNGRHVFINRDNIITVPYSLPIIEKYDKKRLEFKEAFDVLTIPKVDEWYKEVTNGSDMSKPNSIFSMVKDAYLHGNMLYILYFTPMSMLDKTPVEYMGALVFDVGGDEIEYVKRYTFGEDALYKICVTDDYIYGALSGGGVIKRYPLKQ